MAATALTAQTAGPNGRREVPRANTAADASAPRFTVVEATIPELRAALEERRVTSRELVLEYLARIAMYDKMLNAVMVAELVSLAKGRGGKLNYGSAGAGTPGHLTGEMFKTAAGIDIQHVPYRGSAPAVTDLIAGQIQIMFDPLQSVLSNVQGGRLRALAVSSKTRSSALPNVPTIAESGYAGFETTAWWGVFAPAGLAAASATVLSGEIEKIARSDEFRSKLEPLGVVPTALSGGMFAEFQRAELLKWGKAVRDSGASLD